MRDRDRANYLNTSACVASDIDCRSSCTKTQDLNRMLVETITVANQITNASRIHNRNPIAKNTPWPLQTHPGHVPYSNQQSAMQPAIQLEVNTARLKKLVLLAEVSTASRVITAGVLINSLNFTIWSCTTVISSTNYYRCVVEGPNLSASTVQCQDRKKKLDMALKPPYGQQSATTPIPKKRKSRIMKTEVIMPPFDLEDFSRQPRIRSINHIMTHEPFIEALPEYWFPWGKRDIVIGRSFWLSLSCVNTGNSSLLNDHHLDLWIDLMWSFRPPEVDWAIISPHFSTCMLSKIMPDYFSNGHMYPLPWQAVEKALPTYMLALDQNLTYSPLVTTLNNLTLFPIGTCHGIWCFSYGTPSIMATQWNPSIKRSINILVLAFTSQPKTDKILLGFGVRPDTLDPIIIKVSCPRSGQGSWYVPVFTLSSMDWNKLENDCLPRESNRFKRSSQAAVVHDIDAIFRDGLTAPMCISSLGNSSRSFWLSLSCLNIVKAGWLNDNVNEPKTHWCLADLEIRTGVVTFYDSLGWVGGSKRRWWRRMKKLLPEKLTVYLVMHGILERKGISADDYKITYKYADAPFQASLFGDCGIWPTVKGCLNTFGATRFQLKELHQLFKNKLENDRLPRGSIRFKRSSQAVVGQLLFWEGHERFVNDDGVMLKKHLLVSFDLIAHSFQVYAIDAIFRDGLTVPMCISSLGNSLIVSRSTDETEFYLFCGWSLLVDVTSVTSFTLLFSIPTPGYVKLLGFSNDEISLPIVEVPGAH
ncbi:phospholipase-like protein [Tanacetum coccineum]